MTPLTLAARVGAAKPAERLIAVTGAGGFVGGHVVRDLATAGYRVRALSRRPPTVTGRISGVEVLIGDLRQPETRARLVAGAWGVIHCAGWVSLGMDRRGDALAINVDATARLLDEAEAAGVARFVFTSTLWTTAAGTADNPADESTPWNLSLTRCAYCDTKRAAEQLVLSRSTSQFTTCALCPGLVLGIGDSRPTSSRLLLTMAATPIATLPAGGIPIIDAKVLAMAHRRALDRAEPGRRYIVVGPYLSYREMARLVRQVAGWPRWVVPLPGWLRRPLMVSGTLLDRISRGCWGDLSAASVAGGFLALHVRGNQADSAFGLIHPPALSTIVDTLKSQQWEGRFPHRQSIGEPA